MSRKKREKICDPWIPFPTITYRLIDAGLQSIEAIWGVPRRHAFSLPLSFQVSGLDDGHLRAPEERAHAYSGPAVRAKKDNGRIESHDLAGEAAACADHRKKRPTVFSIRSPTRK